MYKYLYPELCMHVHIHLDNRKMLFGAHKKTKEKKNIYIYVYVYIYSNTYFYSTYT